MIDLYLVRHGESEANAAGNLAGHTDSPLSEKGIRQAQNLTEFLISEGLGIDSIFSSPLKRAYNTISEYAAHEKIEIITDERLREKYLGEQENRPAKELFTDDFHRDPYNYSDPHGYESYALCVKRLRGFMEEKIFSQKNSSILISSHAGVTRAIIAVLKNLDQEIPYLRIGNASFTHYRIEEATLRAQCEIFSHDMYLREENLI